MWSRVLRALLPAPRVTWLVYEIGARRLGRFVQARTPAQARRAFRRLEPFTTGPLHAERLTS